MVKLSLTVGGCRGGSLILLKAERLENGGPAMIVLPTAFIGASSRAPARFATVVLGGMVFSTAAALIVLPVLMARIKN